MGNITLAQAQSVVAPRKSFKEKAAEYRAAERGNPNRSRIVAPMVAAAAEAPAVLGDAFGRGSSAVGRTFGRAYNAVAEALDPTDEQPGSAQAPAAVAPVSKTLPGVGGGALPPMQNVTGGASSTAIPEDISSQPSDRERFPGLAGDMPTRFTPEQTAQTLSSLKANEQPYLQTDDRARGPFSLERTKEGSAGGEFMFRGGGQTRGESDWERGSMDRQIAFSEAQDQARQGGEVAALMRAKQIADAQTAIGFEEKYGIPYDPQTARYIADMERDQELTGTLDRNLAAIDAKVIAGQYTPEEAAAHKRTVAAIYGVKAQRGAQPEAYRALNPDILSLQ